MAILIFIGIITLQSIFVNAGPCRAPNVGDGKVVVVDNGREVAEGAIIRDGKDVSLTCNGAAVVSGGTAIANCQDGTLVPALGTCSSDSAPTQSPVRISEPCYAPNVGDGNVFVIENQRQVRQGGIIRDGKEVSIICNGPMVVRGGAFSSICQSGSLLPALGRCSPSNELSCLVPNVGDGNVLFVDNGQEAQVGGIIRQGMKVALACNAGANAIGGAYFADCSDGTLVPTLATCSYPTPPPLPPIQGLRTLICFTPLLSNGQYRTFDGTILVPSQEVDSGVEIFPECDTGFEMTQVLFPSRLCGINGLFDDIAPHCLPISTTTTQQLTLDDFSSTTENLNDFDGPTPNPLTNNSPKISFAVFGGAFFIFNMWLKF